MPWLTWLPWRFLIRRLARAHGFLDPLAVVARLHRFAQPSEVGEPIELLRAGVVFHARGLINSRVIQNNLDWVWPYWIDRQFDPRGDAFIPRAFSITHVNLTHRNWTAIGLPDWEDLPIVDPRGLLTPLYDGWSLDGWVISGEGGDALLPSRDRNAMQRLDMAEGVAVRTDSSGAGMSLSNRAWIERDGGSAVCRMQLQAGSDSDGWLVVALRPYNPEGISFIHNLALSPDRRNWTVDDKHSVAFDSAADRHHVSDYRNGDVYLRLRDLQDQQAGECDIGMVTAAAMFRLDAGSPRSVTVSVPLPGAEDSAPPEITWEQALQGHCRLRLPDERLRFLYDAALRTLVLHSPGDVFPGPYTYKRFWFRDAAFIIHGLLCVGLVERAERALDRFPARQTVLGYFHSQEGEWDANGEVLWIMRRFCELTGRDLKPDWHKALVAGARWIVRKRLADDGGSAHAGLLPAGFSAEHLGPNDYYYWDDFWGVAGLRDAAALCARRGERALHDEFVREAGAFRQAIDRSLADAAARLGRAGMPASPYRRMDAGSIGSIVAGYPLQLYAADDPRLLDTVEFLLQNCFVEEGFFQDMIHSGINPYLTLHVAQVLLRAGDARCFSLIDRVAELASPTGQWPEAIHPRTLGGCMGDGQHVWAAAEWVVMVRNCFVREEGERLVLASGVRRRWLESGEPVSFGPAPTAFGTVSIDISLRGNGSAQQVQVAWTGAWRNEAPTVEIRLPGCAAVTADAGAGAISVDVEADRFT